MLKTPQVIFLFVLITVIGCTGQVRNIANPPDAATELRVYNEACLFSPKGEAGAMLLAPMVTSVLSNSLSRFGSALRKLGEEDTYTETDYRNFEIVAGQPFRCVQVVKGKFGIPQEPVKLGQRAHRDLPPAINLVEKPHFFIELEINPSGNGQFLTLTPTYFEYNRLLKNGSARNASRTLAMQFSFHPAGKAADDRSAVGTTLGMIDVPVGTVRDYSIPPYSLDPLGTQSLWFPTFLPAGTAGGTPGGSSSTPRPEDSMGSAAGSESVPMTMTVTVSETRTERPFILFLADVFDDTKDEIQDELETLLLREKREAAELAAYTDRQAALTRLKQKMVTAEKEFIDYCALGAGSSDADRKARLTASSSLYAAQVDANIAARKAGEADPYPVLVEVSSGPPEGCP
jgi:hypothetical protein